MAEPSTEPVGLWLGIQAGAFLGLYFRVQSSVGIRLDKPR